SRRMEAPAPDPRPSGTNLKPASRRMEAPPPPPPPLPSARRGAAAVAKKKPPMPVKEIGVAGGVLLFIFIIAMVIYYVNTGKNKDIDKEREAQEAIFNRNIQLAEEQLGKANMAGKLFVVGKDKIDAADKTKLFGPFQGNSKI